MNEFSSVVGACLRRFAPVTLAVAAAFTAGQASAVTILEIDDAGQTLATAQNTTSAGPLQSITALSGSVSSSTDADLYLIHIANPAAFFATADGSTTMFDPQLFLLTVAGAPVALNDDAAGGLTTLPMLSGIASLAAGYYILGVSQSGYDPVNSANQLLFANGLTTDIRYAANGLQPATFSGFSDGTFFADSGSYTVQLGGVDSFTATAVPEPASALLLAAGGLLVLSRRRRS